MFWRSKQVAHSTCERCCLDTDTTLFTGIIRVSKVRKNDCAVEGGSDTACGVSRGRARRRGPGGVLAVGGCWVGAGEVLILRLRRGRRYQGVEL